MTTKLNIPRGADLLLRYVFPEDTILTAYECVFNVYTELGGSTLLSVTNDLNPNGSNISPLDNSVSVLIRTADIDGLPVANPETDVEVLFFDFFVTSPIPFTTKVHGGAFIVRPVGSPLTSNGTSFGVNFNGIQISISLEGNTLSTDGFSTLLIEEKTERIAADAVIQADLDTHKANLANPHGTTAAQVGAYTSGQTDTLLGTKEPVISAATSADYWRGDKTFQPVSGLPLSSAAVSALALKAGLTSNTFSGDQTATGSFVNGASGTFRTFQARTGNVPRWIFGADNAAESGSNAGSNFYCDAVNDGNTVASNVYRINRATQIVDLTQSPTIPTPTLGSNNNKAASTAYVDGTGNYPSGLTRSGIATARIAAPVNRIITTDGASRIRGSTAGYDPLTDALGASWQIDPAGLYGDPHWWGALGNAATNDTPAFTSALAAFPRVIARGLTYRIEGLVVPSGKSLEGAGKGLTTFRPTTAATSYCVKVGAGGRLKELTVNGNLVATAGVRLGDAATDSYQYIENVHAQFCTHGFENYSTAWTMMGTSADSNTSDIHSLAGFNNCAVLAHYSRGGSTYGVYLTYTGNPALDQPQAARFTACTFFGQTNGIWFDKNVFDFTFTGSVIDGCTGTAIRIGASSSDITISQNFIGATTCGIDIGEGTNAIIIADNQVANGFNNIIIRATSSLFCTNIYIQRNNIGTTAAGGTSILLDSPQDSWWLMYNNFSSATPNPPLVVVSSTYTTDITGKFNAFGNNANGLSLMATGTRIRAELIKQPRNNVDTLEMVRFTDSSPTGNFIRLQNAAKNADLLKADVLGNLTLAKSIIAESGALSVDASAGVSGLVVSNKSIASNTTKYMAIEVGGFDTVNVYKPGTQVRHQPVDANLVNVNLELYARVADALVRVGMFTDKYVIFDRLTGYVDNAAASAAGVPVGGFYRNTTSNALTQRV